MLKTYKNVYSKLLRAEKNTPLDSRVKLFVELLQQLTTQTAGDETGTQSWWWPSTEDPQDFNCALWAVSDINPRRPSSQKYWTNDLCPPITRWHLLRQHSPTQNYSLKANFTSCALDSSFSDIWSIWNCRYEEKYRRICDSLSLIGWNLLCVGFDNHMECLFFFLWTKAHRSEDFRDGMTTCCLHTINNFCIYIID